MIVTVAELVDRLGDYPADMQVVLSSDEEGNSFRFLWEGSIGESKATLGDWNQIELVSDEDLDEYDETIDVLVLG